MTTRKNDHSNQAAGCALQESPSLASVLSTATAPGDEVIYFGQVAVYDAIIEATGAVPVHVGSSGTTPDMAALASVLSPKTRAIVVSASDGISGNAISRALLATLARLLATARNIFGEPIYLIADESANISCSDQPGARRLSDFYPFTRVSHTAASAA